MDRPRYWFHAKRYGWGWRLPAAWQGWLVLIAYLVFVLGGMPVLHVREGSLACFGFVLLLTGALIANCWIKGEPPRWRWGKRSEDDPK